MLQQNKKGQPQGYGFVTFKAAATVNEFQRSRPHTILGRTVISRRKVLEEEEKMRNKKLRFARVQGPQFGPNEDTLNSDLEEYFGQHGMVIIGSQNGERIRVYQVRRQRPSG